MTPTNATAFALPNYIKPKRISLKNHPTISEKVIQDLIASNPAILGLGDDLIKIGKEVTLPSGGRLDFLFASGDDQRYEVEVQLGATDPSHIIRTIEYWDLERSRYPEREHVAVLVAEDITSRFLNVISLLNKSIPLIAIQMQALEVGQYLTLVFTTVVDRFSRPDDEDDEGQSVVTKADWESRKGLKAGLEIVGELAGYAQNIDPNLILKFNQNFIQVNKHGRIFLTFYPQQVQTKIEVRMVNTAESEELKSKMVQGDVDVEYKEKGKSSKYRIAVDNDKFKDQAADIKALISLGLKALE
jgi:hypothetical protein